MTARLDRLAAVAAVSALPGAGKTDLVACWARRQADGGAALSWIDAAGATTGIGARVEAAEAAAADGRTAIVVIDNADAATGDETVDALCAALSRTSRLHVVICGRSWHPLVPAAWSRGLSVTTVTGHDLQATPDELIRLAAAWGHGDAGAAAVAGAHTGGWMVPARLILDAASPAAGQEVAADYLRAVVLPTIPDDGTRTAALRLALAEIVTPVHLAEVGAAQTPAASGDEVLTRLLRTGLVVPGPDQETWRIVPVLRAALLAQYASRSAGDIARWHDRFARALADAGETTYLGVVVRHARAARDWPLLTQLWETTGLALAAQHPDDVVAGYGRLHGRVLAEHPALRVPAAVARALTRHPDGVRTQQAVVHAIRRAGAALLRADPATAASARLRLQLRSVTIVADRLAGRYEQAIAGATALNRDLADREHDPRAAPVPVHRAWVLHQWARTLLLAGDGRASVAVATRAFAAAHDLDAPVVVARVAADLALAHAVDGSAGDARLWLGTYARYGTGTGTGTGTGWMADLARPPAQLAYALLALDRLDPAAAHDHLVRAEEETGQGEVWPFFVHVFAQHALTDGEPAVALAVADRYAVLNPRAAAAGGVATRILTRCRVDLHLALGEVNLAQRLLRDAGADQPWLRTSWARFHLVCGDEAQAVRVAEAGAWDPATAPRTRIELLMIKAAAHEAQGDSAAADRAFARAGALTSRLGIQRSYALVDAHHRDLLLKRSGSTLDPDTLTRLAHARRVYPARAELVTLTERELAVLYQLARHKSWSDIANALVVAPSTVKKQILSLYAKLDVHDRDAALLRATRLGFLPEPHG